MEATITREDTASEVLQFVTFTLNNEDYAVNILHVQEINRITEISIVPNSPMYIAGVINLRGKVIPVINLRRKFSYPEKEMDESSRIIIMDINGITNGLIVDSVSEVLRIQAHIIDETPPMSSNINSKFIKGIARLENRLLIVLNTNKLIGEEY